MKKSDFLFTATVFLASFLLVLGAHTSKAFADDTQSPEVPPITITQSTDVTPPVIDTDADTQSTETVTPTITIEGTAVICDTDAAMPHWGLGTSITATTASDYVAHSNGHCQFAPNWNFQWSDQSTDPHTIAGDLVGGAPGFTTFGPTDANGSATVTVSFPNTITEYHVREELQAGYIPFTFNENTRDNSNTNSAEFYCEGDGLNYDDFEYVRNPMANDTYHCVGFNVSTSPVNTGPGNTQTSDTGGNGGGGSGGIAGPSVLGNTSGGTSGGNGGGSSAPQGQVLGASTSCGEYITSYLQMGQSNDVTNVKNLQTFLNSFMHASLSIDGLFGNQTFDTVKQFQVKETNDVLLPWKNLGNPNLVGTGYVYKTTKWKINNIMCPSLNEPMPQLP